MELNRQRYKKKRNIRSFWLRKQGVSSSKKTKNKRSIGAQSGVHTLVSVILSGHTDLLAPENISPLRHLRNQSPDVHGSFYTRLCRQIPRLVGSVPSNVQQDHFSLYVFPGGKAFIPYWANNLPLVSSQIGPHPLENDFPFFPGLQSYRQSSKLHLNFEFQPSNTQSMNHDSPQPSY